MRALTILLLVGLWLIASTSPADGGPNATASIAVHGTTNAKARCTYLPPIADCGSIVTSAGAPSVYRVFVLAVNGSTTTGVAGIQFGIDYDGNPASGADVMTWTSCADLEYQTASPAFPAPGSGNLIVWASETNCQTAPGDSSFFYAIAGYFYIYAYSPDLFSLTPHPLDGKAKVADCSAVEDDITSRLPSALGVFGFGLPGHNPCDAPRIETSPDSLFFTLQQGGAAGDGVTVANPGGQTLVWDVGAGCGWITALPDSGSVAPGGSQNVAITVDTGSLAPGGYVCDLVFNSNDPLAPQDTVWVSLTVLAAPTIALDPPSFAFSLKMGGAVCDTLTVSNPGGDILGWSIAEGCPWLTAVPDTGTTPSLGADEVEICVSASGLGPGVHVCDLLVSSNDPASPLDTVAVTLEVLPPRAWHVPAEAPTIQAGVDSAAFGDSVLVATGVYSEGGIVLKSGVLVMSETGTPDAVTINAQGLDRIFSCDAVDSTTTVRGFTITGGSAPEGAGVYCRGASPRFDACIFLSNRGGSSSKGGGIYCADSSRVVMTQCTFYDNEAAAGGGIYSDSFSSVILMNSIVASSRAGGALACDPSASATLTCCDVHGNAGGDWTGCIAGQEAADGNFSADPLLCDPRDGDLTLRSNSPCAPANSGGCGLIGALDVLCTVQPEPVIALIEDVPNDQGRRARIGWFGSQYDASGQPYTITGYAIWRRVDGNLGPDPHPVLRPASLLEYPPGDWEYLQTTPARGEGSYKTIVETLCDSTIASGQCLSVYFVSAVTPDPTVFFDSEPDSGYSVDNLAPNAPMSFKLMPPALLTWDEALEEDFDYFKVYGSDGSAFDSTAVPLAATIETSLDVLPWPYSYYHVTVTDFAGNEGEAASTANPVFVREQGLTPSAYALAQNWPNPFRSTTSIQFDLPEAAPVHLSVFDVRGALVSTLLTRELPEGRYTVAWLGRVDTGQKARPGVYFFRLQAGPFSQTRKALLLR